MLTSSASQYLHPDYLQPLPTTLDAKKSPLALLAQTCSSIGKDPSPTKSIIPPIEKKDGHKDCGKDGTKSSSPNSSKGGSSSEEKVKGSSSSSSASSADKRDGSSPGRSSSSRGDSPRSFRTPAPKDIPPLVPITSSSAGDKSSSADAASPKSTSSTTAGERDSTSVTTAIPHPVASTVPSAGAQSNSRISLSCGSMLLEVNHNEAASKCVLPTSHSAIPGSLKPEGLSASAGAFHPSLGAYPGCTLPLLGHPIDAATASSVYAAGISAHSIGLSAAQKAAVMGVPHPGASALSPYVTYARVKTTSGATTLVPVCKDPYCTHCQMTLQSAQLTTGCGAGCTQCNHEKSFSVPTSLGLGGLPMHSVLPPSIGGGASSLPLSSSLYPHAFGVLPGHQGLPYVCNWMAGSDYCGKRFNTSEELLQHLRSHTSSVEAGAGFSHAGLPYSSLGLLAAPGLGCHGHYSTASSLSPNSLRQAYPRSLSPNTLLAASRYHPYKSPLSSLSTPVSSFPASAGIPSALSAYYSPYSLYGPRIGAAVAP